MKRCILLLSISLLMPLCSCASTPSSGELASFDQNEKGTSPFEKSFEQEDGIFQFVLHSILKSRESPEFDGQRQSDRKLFVYSESNQEKTFSPRDFPEIAISDIEQHEVRFGKSLLLTLPSEMTLNEAQESLFRLIDNDLVTYACFNQAIEEAPWTKWDYAEPLQTSSPAIEEEEPSPLDEEALQEIVSTDYAQNYYFPGYVKVWLKQTENGNDKEYAPQDFPDCGLTQVVELSSNGYSRRILVGKAEDQSFQGSIEGIRRLMQNQSVYLAQLYGSGSEWWV